MVSYQTEPYKTFNSLFNNMNKVFYTNPGHSLQNLPSILTFKNYIFIEFLRRTSSKLNR